MLIVRKNQIMEQEYHVCKYAHTGEFLGVVSGMGRNRGTWDATHGRRTVQRHAALLRQEEPSFRFHVEPAT